MTQQNDKLLESISNEKMTVGELISRTKLLKDLYKKALHDETLKTLIGDIYRYDT